MTDAKFIITANGTFEPAAGPRFADYVRINIARKMQASGRYWRDQAVSARQAGDYAREKYERSRREVEVLRAEFAKQVDHTGVQMRRAERLEDAIRTYHATLTDGGYVDTVARTEALAKLMEVVE